MIVPQTITKAQFTATVAMGGVAPLSVISQMTIPMSFDSVQHMKNMTGQYTPNNDYLYLQQNIQAPSAPNFLILLCDSPMAITLSYANNAASWLVNRFSFLSWVQDPNNPLQGIFIDGRLNPNPGVSVMAQGVACNYSLLTGQANIT